MFLRYFALSFGLFWHHPHLKLITFALSETAPVSVASIHNEQCWKRQVTREENAYNADILSMILKNMCEKEILTDTHTHTHL